ncbi:MULTISPECIES: hypothetical protein [unclassified Thiocapsa]|uniref:hypothetical protein n=1 Tax=unclassified Thiocapsa TaxID=2641286 RepID=UPI0035B1BF40
MTAKSADDPTLAYYEDQAETFFAETVDVNMAPLNSPFPRPRSVRCAYPRNRLRLGAR